MKSAVESLFQLLCQRITEEDIRTFCPVDPGYQNYVSKWTKLLKTADLPNKSDFEICEVIGLTTWATPETYDHPDQFRVFRLFNRAVAFHLYNLGEDPDVVNPVKHSTIRLLNDAQSLNDQEIIELIGDILAETAAAMKSDRVPDSDYPFLYAGEMIWAQRTGDFHRADRAAQLLIEEEQEIRNYYGPNCFEPAFLQGLSNYDQLDDLWLQALSELTNPNQCEETQLVIEALSSN